LLKKNLALATLRAPYGKPGTRVRVEVTVEYERRHVTATVAETPFFNPERKRS
jgi:glycine cleavage system aminomethyltransferase T